MLFFYRETMSIMLFSTLLNNTILTVQCSETDWTLSPMMARASLLFPANFWDDLRRSTSWQCCVDLTITLRYSPTSTWLVSTRHDSTRSTYRAHAFWLCRASRTAQLDSLDTTRSIGATCNLVMITVIHLLFNISYSLIYWSIHLFNLFRAEQIGFVCVRKNKNTCNV